MENFNLPESLYVDYTVGASNSNTALRSAVGAQSFTTFNRTEIDRLIMLLNPFETRAEAIVRLITVYKTNKERGPELGLLLWNSKGAIFALLQELQVGYRLLSPNRLGMPETTKICNALLLIQCMASHPEARTGVIKTNILVYFYPFLNTSDQQVLQFEYLRLSGLGVVAAFLKETGARAPEIVRYLLEIETVPLCLRCMEIGGSLTKSVAALVLGKILGQHEGKVYFGSFIERFFSVIKTLSKIVDGFTGKPPSALLMNVLVCYLRLSEISRLVGCRDSLRGCYPRRLKDSAYLNIVCEGSTRGLADQVLQNLMEGQEAQPAPPPPEHQFAGMRA